MSQQTRSISPQRVVASRVSVQHLGWAQVQADGLARPVFGLQDVGYKQTTARHQMVGVPGPGVWEVWAGLVLVDTVVVVPVVVP